jgi:ribonuclease R
MSKEKQNRIVNKTEIINLIKSGEKSLDVKTIMQRLKLPNSARGQVKQMLKKLAKRGDIEQKRRKFAGQADAKTITGRIDLRNDYGFLIMPDGNDIFIGRDSAEDLLPGDIIEVYPHKSRAGGIEGELKKIVKRTESPVMCRVRKFGDEVFAVLTFKPGPIIKIRKPSEALGEGDLILVTVDYENGRLFGTVISHLYDKTDMKLYMQFILAKNGIRQPFPDKVLSEAAQMAIDTSNLGNRVDLRNEIIVTVDPKDAKDFDDAVSVEKTGGKYRLGVHIADVTHYMKEGSNLDEEASLRGTSVYLPGSVIPMQPEKLSNDLCSLREGVDRMTFSIFMDIDENGFITSYQIKESIINNKKRFTYEEVLAILKGGECGDPKIKEALFIMDELKEKLKKNFENGGSIDFDLGEPVFVYNADWTIADIVRKEQTDANKLIEFFMISANVCAADFITRNSKFGMFRVHEKPFQKDIDDFNSYMRGMGIDVTLHKGTNSEFQQVLRKIRDSDKKNLVQKKLLRSMKLARYSEKNLGHFGLGLEKYTHFTSPIRRYADVIVHRLIKHFSSIETMKDVDKAYLKKTADNISDCEERAEKSENDGFRLYCLDFLKDRVGDEFEAVISRVTKNGFVVELNRYPVEGFINFDVLDEYYVFDQFRQAAVAKRSKKIIKAGDNISVIIMRIDLESLKLELEPKK